MNYNELKNNNIAVMIDNSEKSPGFKFAEAEVNGIPVRIEIGSRDFENNQITLARRDTKEKIAINLDCDITKEVTDLMDDIQANLLRRATERRDRMTYEARNIEEFKNIMENTPGFVKADWCGNVECEEKIKEIRGTKSRCIIENEKLLTGKCVVCGNDAKHLVTWGIQY